MRNTQEEKTSGSDDQLDEEIEEEKKSRLTFYNFSYWVKKKVTHK